MLDQIRRALLDALAIVSPIECAGCGTPGSAICPECLIHLRPSVTPRRVGERLTVFTALRYEGVVRQIILALKENGRTDVVGALANSFTEAVARVVTPGVEIATIPTSRTAWRRRGYDPVGLVTRRTGHAVARVLAHGRTTASQKTLGLDKRERNVEGSMSAKTSLVGRSFIIIDDVLTTGATFTEAARAIGEAGGTVVAGAAIAFTPRLFGAQGNPS